MMHGSEPRKGSRSRLLRSACSQITYIAYGPYPRVIRLLEEMEGDQRIFYLELFGEDRIGIGTRQIQNESQRSDNLAKTILGTYH